MRRRHFTVTLAALLLGQLACSPPTAPGPTATTANPANQPPTDAAPAQLFQPEIRGLVREVDGGPIAGADVQAFYNYSILGVSVTSDSNGRFMLPARSGATPVFLSVRKGTWGDKYVWGDGARVNPSADPSPVSVELRLQASLTLVENTELTFQLSDDALSFRYPDAFACGPCRVLYVKPAQLQDFELRVRASEPVPFRVILIGSREYDDILFGEASSEPGSSEVVLRITREQLGTTQYPVRVYVEKRDGLASQSLSISLTPVK